MILRYSNRCEKTNVVLEDFILEERPHLPQRCEETLSRNDTPQRFVIRRFAFVKVLRICLFLVFSLSVYNHHHHLSPHPALSHFILVSGVICDFSHSVFCIKAAKKVMHNRCASGKFQPNFF